MSREDSDPCCPMCLVASESAGPELDWLFGAATGLRVHPGKEDMYLCAAHEQTFNEYMKAIDGEVVLTNRKMS